jgi:hypothetical protein
MPMEAEDVYWVILRVVVFRENEIPFHLSALSTFSTLLLLIIASSILLKY